MILKGNVDGKEILFERTGEDDEWTAVIPASLNGRYVVELLAIDDAGNETYWAKYIVTIDVTKMCVHLVPLEYQTEIIDTEFEAKLQNDDFIIEVVHPACREGGAIW